jgi:hypothetical protein
MSSKTRSSRLVVYAALSASLSFTTLSIASDMAEFATGGYARGVQTETMMNNIDTNHDGRISKSEWLAYQERVWKALDKDASGVVNETQFLTPSVSMTSFATGGYARVT